jgi:CubicO group peptidase (beta-lactamase class C family)
VSAFAIGDLLDRRIEAGDFSGAVALTARGEAPIDICARGLAAVEPEEHAAGPETVFDLGDLTRAAVTAPLALLLHHHDGVDLDIRAAKVLPELDRLDKREITLRHLLLHSSGLPEWIPLYAHGLGMRDYLRVLRETAPEAACGALIRDSALGYLLLGEALARVASAPLERLARELLFDPLGTAGLGFGPRPVSERPRIAPTERDETYERERAGRRAEKYRGWRSGVLWGEVHDHCTWTLGGASGDAGLFGAARDLLALGVEMLGHGRGLFPEPVRRLLLGDATPGHARARTHGWKLVRRGAEEPGNPLPFGAVGHDSFTGASLWIEPRNAEIFILLANRVHPRVRPSDMDSIRREFHACALSKP